MILPLLKNIIAIRTLRYVSNIFLDLESFYMRPKNHTVLILGCRLGFLRVKETIFAHNPVRISTSNTFRMSYKFIV